MAWPRGPPVVLEQHPAQHRDRATATAPSSQVSGATPRRSASDPGRWGAARAAAGRIQALRRGCDRAGSTVVAAPPIASRAASAAATVAAPAGRSSGLLASRPCTRSASQSGVSGRSVAHVGHRVVGVHHHRRDRRRRLERRPAGQQGVEHAAERVEVGAAVDPPAHGLLGGEVLGGAHDRVGGGERLRAGRLGELGDAEVEHPHPPVGGVGDVAGLMSRCTSPRAWAASSAEATWRPTSTTSSTGSGPSASRSARLGPGSSSMTM